MPGLAHQQIEAFALHSLAAVNRIVLWVKEAYISFLLKKEEAREGQRKRASQDYQNCAAARTYQNDYEGREQEGRQRSTSDRQKQRAAHACNRQTEQGP